VLGVVRTQAFRMKGEDVAPVTTVAAGQR